MRRALVDQITVTGYNGVARPSASICATRETPWPGIGVSPERPPRNVIWRRSERATEPVRGAPDTRHSQATRKRTGQECSRQSDDKLAGPGGGGALFAPVAFRQFSAAAR